MRKIHLLLYSLIFSFSSLYSYSVTRSVDTPRSYDNDGTCSADYSAWMYEPTPSGIYNNYQCADIFGGSQNDYLNDGSNYWTNINTVQECVDTSLTTYTVNVVSTKFEKCFKQCNLTQDSCSGDEIFNSDTCSCSPPPCLNEHATLNLPQNKCFNSYTDYAGDGSGTVYSDLYWQPCDSTCRGVVSGFKDCESIVNVWKNACKQNEVFLHNCQEIDGKGVLNPESAKCIPSKNPCDDLYSQFEASCALNEVVGGECKHNGLKVTTTSYACEVPEDDKIQEKTDCRLARNAIWSDSSNSCICKDGFTKTSFGVCWKNLDSNATDEQINKDNEDKKEAEKEKKKEESDNNSTKSQTNSLDNAEDTLSGIRKDLNVTNALLAQIADNTKDDNNSDPIDYGNLDFLDEAINGIMTKYSFEFGGGSCGTISPITVYFHGSTLTFLDQATIDLLPMFSMRAIVVFMFTISALSLVFRSN